MQKVVVRAGRAKPLWRGHPWVYRDSIAEIEGSPGPGDSVQVHDSRGKAIGCGYFSPESKIAVRIHGPEPEIDFAERVAAAVRLRRETLALPVVTDGYRLVHAEGDRLPGLVVDHFAGTLAVQFSTVGMHRRRDAILDALEQAVGPDAIFEQPDLRAAKLEGFETRPQRLRGGQPAEPPSILEHGVCLRVGIGAGAGQKTGFFSDQRENRHAIGKVARDRTVLDLHTYTGGFGLHAAVNGAAEVLSVDSSGPALSLAAENAMLNNVRAVRYERSDVKAMLNRLSGERRRFDIVVCDPPKFARNRAGVKRALAAYRDLHLRAMRVVAPGGLLAAASCSGLVTESDFEQTLRDAAYDLGRSVQVVHRAGQAADHPVLATCPEGRYLKFVVASIA